MVNTFFTDSDPEVTAKSLDDRRLGKQRVEAKQIIDLIDGNSKTGGWKAHPAVLMWVGYSDALKDYFNIMVNEWIDRGYNNTMELYQFDLDYGIEYPKWTLNDKVLFSHQARLIQKMPSHYSTIFNPPKEYLKHGYIWPHKYSYQELENLEISELAEDYVEEVICSAVKKDQVKCSNKALYGDKCGVHKSKDWTQPICQARLKDGRPCSHKAKNGNFCGTHNR